MVIAAARLAKYKEHNNDHQKQIIREFADDGYILELRDFDKLGKLILKAKTFKPKKFTSNTKNMVKLIEDYIEEENHTSWYNKVKEILWYGFFGVLTTVVNIVSFYFLDKAGLNTYLANDTTEKIRLYIQNNYTKNISIKDLENLVFLSKNQIIKLFKKNYNMTPHKYIIEIRLDNACDLLLSTDRTINTIASSVGFSDYSIFYKAFVNKYGISPEEYRHLSNKSKSPIKGTNPPK